MKGLISVIIPTHNRANLLNNAINSVLAQTYKNFEIIVVDDASADNTKETVESFKSNKIIYLKNDVSLKSSGARNVGINNSNGEFIAFLDDDDIWFSSKLEKQIKKFENSKVGIVYSSIELYFVRYNIFYNTVRNKKGMIYKDLLIKNHIGGTVSVVIRKRALSDSGLFDNQFLAREEYDLWLRISKKWEVDFISEPLVKAYHRNEITRISTNLDNYITSIDLLNKKYVNEVNNLLTYKEKKARIADQNFFLGSQAIKIYNAKLARKYFLKAFLINFNSKSILSYLLSFFGVKTVIMSKYFTTKINRKK